MVGIKSALFGKLAVEAKFITEEQLKECLERQKELATLGEKPPRLGEILEEKGYLTRQQITAILEAMHSVKKGLFGEIAISLHFITLEQLQVALDIQRLLKIPFESVSLFGNALIVYRNFLRVVKETSKIPKIGEILVALGYLRQHQVDVVLREQNKKILPCPNCKANLNVTPFRSNSKIKCGSCQAILFLQESKDKELELVLHQEEEVVQPTEEKPAPPPPSTKPSTTPRKTNLVGNYKILKKLGQDATGIVYMAEDTVGRKIVALKIFHSACSEDENFSKNLLNNSKKVISLEHPNIKKILSIGDFSGRFYVASEYIEGESIYNIITKQTKLPPLNSVRIAIKVANALNYAHRFGLLHMDIRPSNILILNSGEVKLANLGLPNRAIENILAISRSGHLAPFYVAPEQVTGDRPVDLRADIYGLGATLYHMISGRPPFEGQSPLEILLRLTEETIPPLSVYEPSIPESISSTVEKAIQAEPQDRYQDYDSFVQDLLKSESELSKAEILTTKPSTPKRTIVSPVTDIPLLPIEEAAHPATKTKVKKVFSTSVTSIIGPIIIVAIIVAIIFLIKSGIATPKWQQEYDRCMETQKNYPKSYLILLEQWQKFLENHPDSPKKEEVRQRIYGIKRDMESIKNQIFNEFKNQTDDLIKKFKFQEAITKWDNFVDALKRQQVYYDEIKMYIDNLIEEQKDTIKNKILELIDNKKREANNIANDKSKPVEKRYDEAISLLQHFMEQIKMEEYSATLREEIDRLQKEIASTSKPDRFEKESKQKYENCLKECESLCNTMQFDKAIQLIESTIFQIHTTEYKDKLNEYKSTILPLKRFLDNTINRVNSVLNQYRNNPRNDIRPEIEIQPDLVAKINEISKVSVTFVTKDNRTLVKNWTQLSPETILKIALVGSEYSSAQDFFDIASFALRKELYFDAEKYFNIAKSQGMDVSNLLTFINEKISEKGIALLNEIKNDFSSDKPVLSKLSELKTKYADRKFYKNNQKNIEELTKDSLLKISKAKGSPVYYTFEGLTKIPDELNAKKISISDEILHFRENYSQIAYTSDKGVTFASFLFNLSNVNSNFVILGNSANFEFKLTLTFEREKSIIKFTKSSPEGMVSKPVGCNIKPEEWYFISISADGKYLSIYIDGTMAHPEDFLSLEEIPTKLNIQFKQDSRDPSAEMKVDNILILTKD